MLDIAFYVTEIHVSICDSCDLRLIVANFYVLLLLNVLQIYF